VDIQYDLNDYMSRLNYDYSILDEIDFNNGEVSDFSAGIINTESSNTKVPTLIYDGPFADSVLNKEIVGLKNIEYSVEDVEEFLHTIYGSFSINYLGDSIGKFETYNFEILGDVELYVSVTKKGGFLLTITAFGSGEGDKNLTVEEGINLAELFAKDVGINNMYTVWHQNTGKVLYVNLAPIVNKVIHYSDLIKVKIDLTTGLVVGWEGTNYATNHKDRTFTSVLGILDCEKKINNMLTIKERNLCIIPDKYVGELSAYEYICTWKNYTYYIYIDSDTGKEVNILRVIETDNGSLLM
jgi:germination protein YpeB